MAMISSRIRSFLSFFSLATPRSRLCVFCGGLMVLALWPFERLRYLPIRSIWGLLGIPHWSEGMTRAFSKMMHADFAAAWLKMLSEPQDFIHRVRCLIMATKHDKVIDDRYNDEQFIADIDLLPLSYDESEFNRLSDCIRLEYHWVPEEDYKKGRKGVLQSFLDRQKIYYSVQLRHHELWARKNLARSIKKLA